MILYIYGHDSQTGITSIDAGYDNLHELINICLNYGKC